MPGFRLETWIARPPAAVWAVLEDLEQAPRWMPGMEMLAFDDEGPLQPGSVYRFRVEGLKGVLQKGVVVAVAPCRELVLSSERGRVAATYTYRLAPRDEGTAVSLQVEVAVHGWLRPFAPLLVRLMRGSDAGQLEALKQDVEGPAGSRQNALSANPR